MKLPKNYTNLHSHTNASLGDALGTPQEHIEFVLKNGGDSLAMTDHGNMNGFAKQQTKLDKLHKTGASFKGIPGVEAYYIDSLSDWSKLKAETSAKTMQEKALAKQITLSSIGNELEQTEEDLEEIEASKQTVDKDAVGGLAVEDESESKTKTFNPLYQRNHLVLLPKNSQGLKSLFRLVSESYANGFYRYPRIDLDLLRKYCNGNIIGLSACISGNLAKIVFDNVTDIKTVSNENFELIQKLLKEKVELFAEAFCGYENYYAEIQFNKLGSQHLVNMHLLELSKRTSVKLVATADAHYSNPDHWREREIYKAMLWSTKNKSTVELDSLPQTIDELKCELYPKNADQMWESYKNYCSGYEFYNDQLVCDAIERTHDIAHQQIGEIAVDKSIKLPKIERLVDPTRLEQYKNKLPEATEDQLAFKELVTIAIQGLKNRGKLDKDEYVERLKKELDDIKYLQEHSHLRFAKYFLTQYKIMEVVQPHMLSGTGRGSGAGSLLNYALGITQVDPIRFGLLWERFMPKFKNSAADIDSDFSDRDKAVKLITNWLGEENVIPITNFNSFQLRSLMKDLSKLHGIPFHETNEVTSKMELEVLSEKKKTPGFDRQSWEMTYEEADLHSPSFRKYMRQYPELEKTVKILYKQGKSCGRHAGGILITDNAMDNMPLIKNGGELQTPWVEGLAVRELEDLGFLKFDILGLGTLAMFEDTVRKILIKEGVKHPIFSQIKKWFWDHLHPDTNKMDDINVYKYVFWNGHYAGIFSFVNEPVQKFMKEMKPKSIEDIAAATSIFRPGPLGMKVDVQYLRNRHNPSQIHYHHPKLQNVLGETMGFIIYQEQLQRIYNELAGVPLEQTDAIRKAFTKKDLSNKAKAELERQNLKQEFIAKCKSHSGITEAVSSKIFEDMCVYVSYSFNKCLAKDSLVETKEKGIIPITQVVPGEHVNSVNGFVPVKAVHKNGQKKLYRIKTRTGKTLTCTLDHKLQTPNGMKTLKEILENRLQILVQKQPKL